jgi:hypothetical protein
MIAKHLNIANVRQCQSPAEADVGCPPGKIVDVYAGSGISCALRPRALDPTEIETEIDSKSPVLVLINWHSGGDAGGSHIMLISGFDAKGNIYVIDSRKHHGDGLITYDSLVTAQG